MPLVVIGCQAAPSAQPDASAPESVREFRSIATAPSTTAHLAPANIATVPADAGLDGAFRVEIPY
jgi:hypothetical protein